MNKKLLAVILALAAIIPTAITAETFNLQYDPTFLHSANSTEDWSMLEDGTAVQDVSIDMQFRYPANYTLDHTPRPISADPMGTLFELFFNDGAGIFAPKPPAPTPEEEEQALLELEPERVYTEEEQAIADKLNEHCGDLNKRLNAIGRFHNFLLEHSMDWYVDHPDKATLKSEECRGTKKLGDNVLSSMYDELAKETEEDEKRLNATGTQGPRPHLAVNITGIMVSEADRAQGKIDNSTYLGYPEKLADRIVKTNQTTDTMTAEEAHTYEQEYRINNRIILCSDILWPETGNGSVSLRNWPTKLLDGFCEEYVFITQWEYNEDGFQEKVTKKVDLNALIEQKTNGDE